MCSGQNYALVSNGVELDFVDLVQTLSNRISSIASRSTINQLIELETKYAGHKDLIDKLFKDVIHFRYQIDQWADRETELNRACDLLLRTGSKLRTFDIRSQAKNFSIFDLEQCRPDFGHELLRNCPHLDHRSVNVYLWRFTGFVSLLERIDDDCLLIIAGHWVVNDLMSLQAVAPTLTLRLSRVYQEMRHFEAYVSERWTRQTRRIQIKRICENFLRCGPKLRTYRIKRIDCDSYCDPERTSGGSLLLSDLSDYGGPDFINRLKLQCSNMDVFQHNYKLTKSDLNLLSVYGPSNTKKRRL